MPRERALAADRDLFSRGIDRIAFYVELFSVEKEISPSGHFRRAMVARFRMRFYVWAGFVALAMLSASTSAEDDDSEGEGIFLPALPSVCGVHQADRVHGEQSMRSSPVVQSSSCSTRRPSTDYIHMMS
eukprot:3534340-Rhodomonas_salina.2